MKINFKKVANILGSALMIGATAGIAAAASYPAPFVQSGAANVAIVVGQNAALSDGLAATSISSNLATTLAAQTATGSTTSTSTVSGGDSVEIIGAGDSRFGLGDLASSVLVTSINSDKMPNLLVDGQYLDSDNTEYKYTQKLTLGSAVKLNHFSDSDYKDKVPTVGVNLSDSQVLNYTLDFDTNPLFNASQMETTTLTMMGKDYYVLDVVNGTTDTLTLLDSANAAVVSEGESKTITVGNNSYEVAISFIDSSKVKLTVNGQTTNSLATGGTYKLSDGSYIGVKDILFNSKDSGVSKAEISIGKGKLEITSGQTVQLNDDTVNEITGTISLDSLSQVDKIILTWTTDGKAFVTPDSSLTMPGFESVKISMADWFTSKQEVTTVKNSGSDVIELRAPIKSGDATIPLLNANSGAFAGIGKDSNNKLATTSASSFIFNQTSGDKYIVASWNSSTEAETYYLKVEMVQEDSVNKTKFTNVLDTTEYKTVSTGNDVTFGNVVITVQNVNYSGTIKWANLTAGSGVNFNTLYTAAGMKVYLPFNATSGNGNSSAIGEIYLPGTTNSSIATNHNATKYALNFSEQDKDSNLGKNGFGLLLGSNSDGKVEVKSVGSADADRSYEIGDSEDYESYIVSDLATKVVQKTSADQDWAEVTYAGGQSYADAFITAPNAMVSAGSSSSGSATELGSATITDAEVSSASNKNLIVIGGSCINSVAADLLGGAKCGADFTAATGINAGEALIKSFDRSGNVALLVAGYNAEDTAKAATYLVNKGANTSVGSALKVTSATEATAITA